MKPPFQKTKKAMRDFFVNECDFRQANVWHVGDGAHANLLNARVMSVSKMDGGHPQIPHVVKAIFPNSLIKQDHLCRQR